MNYNQLEACYNESFDCIFILDQTLIIQYWNFSMQAFIGIVKDKAIGKALFEVIPSLEGACKHYLEEAVLRQNRHIELQQLTFVKPVSGKTATAKARFFPIERLDRSAQIGCIFQALYVDGPNENDFSNLLRSVVINTKDAVLITSAQDIEHPSGPKIIYANPVFTEMTGYTPEDVLGLTPRILQGLRTDPKSKQLIRDALKKWQPIDCEILNYKKDGEEFWIDLGIVPIKNKEGFFTHWIAIQRNTTQKRRNLKILEETNVYLEERVKERTADLELFSKYLAHDLKSPLKNIHSLIDLIATKFAPFPADISALFALVRQSSASVYGMINGLSRLVAIDHVPIEKVSVPFIDIVKQASANLAELVDQTEAKIIATALPTVSVDYNLMVNMVQNLLSNSIKYAGELPPQIKIESIDEDQNWHLTFADQGLGIAENQLLEVFDIFYRSQTTDAMAGDGVGLAICKKIADRHAGSMHIEPHEGPGCTVHLILPQ